MHDMNTDKTLAEKLSAIKLLWIWGVTYDTN